MFRFLNSRQYAAALLAGAVLPACKGSVATRFSDTLRNVDVQVELFFTRVDGEAGIVTARSTGATGRGFWYGVRHNGPLANNLSLDVVLRDAGGVVVLDGTFSKTMSDLHTPLPCAAFRRGEAIQMEPALAAVVESHLGHGILWIAHTEDPASLQGFHLRSQMSDGDKNPPKIAELDLASKDLRSPPSVWSTMQIHYRSR